MNIRQLKAIQEVVKQGLKVSAAAQVLCKAQPGVSRQIKEIEEEIGVEIFHRAKNRITGLTSAGRKVLKAAERILHEVENLQDIGREMTSPNQGAMTIATTHTHARYSLPPVIDAFMSRFPDVELTIRQSNPAEACKAVIDGEADIAICTEPARKSDGLVSIPIYTIEWDLVASARHPILREKRITVDTIARYPLIAHDAAFSGKRVATEALSKARHMPRVILSGVHADVSKAYVERGLGLAVLAKIAFEPAKDSNLRLLKVEHLFSPTLLHLHLRRHKALRAYVLSFISLYAPHLSRTAVVNAIDGADSAKARKRPPPVLATA